MTIPRFLAVLTVLGGLLIGLVATPADASGCPGVGHMRGITGVHVVHNGSEFCAFHFSSNVPHAFTCPSGMVCDVEEEHPRRTVTYTGHGQTVNAFAATVRVLSGYPHEDRIHDICAHWVDLSGWNGREDPPVQVYLRGANHCHIPGHLRA